MRLDISAPIKFFHFNLHLTIENYRQVLEAQGMLQAFANTVFIAVPSTLLPLGICALDLADIEISDQGLILTIRRSKTDQTGAGRKVGIPARQLRSSAWIEVGGITSAPLFSALDRGHAGERISGQAIAEIVKRAALRVGLDTRRYAAHSLRSGFATSAARGGADLPFIMQQTGHRSADSRAEIHSSRAAFVKPGQ